MKNVINLFKIHGKIIGTNTVKKIKMKFLYGYLLIPILNILKLNVINYLINHLKQVMIKIIEDKKDKLGNSIGIGRHPY